MLTIAMALLIAFVQGVGWTAGIVATLAVVMVSSDVIEWMWDKTLERNGLK